MEFLRSTILIIGNPVPPQLGFSSKPAHSLWYADCSIYRKDQKPSEVEFVLHTTQGMLFRRATHPSQMWPRGFRSALLAGAIYGGRDRPLGFGPLLLFKKLERPLPWFRGESSPPKAAPLQSRVPQVREHHRRRWGYSSPTPPQTFPVAIPTSSAYNWLAFVNRLWVPTRVEWSSSSPMRQIARFFLIFQRAAIRVSWSGVVAE
jgi:hypothetical protein